MEIGVVHPNLMFRRGGEFEAVQVLQALQEHDVELVTYRDPDVAALNDHFGTDLAQDRLSVRTPRFPRSVFRHTEELFFKMRNNALKRYARAVRDDYDLLFSTMNEADFGEAGVQRILFPEAVNERLFHETGEATRDLAAGVDSHLYRAYLAAVERFFLPAKDGVERNVTLCNSAFTRDVYEKIYDNEARVLTPPVAAEFDDPSAFTDRANGFLMIGATPEKNADAAIRIIDRVREAHDVHLTIAGALPDGADDLRSMIRERDHVEHVGEVPRGELLDLIASHRYGIHAFPGEHYGLAPAEMVKGGCIVFVPDVGGPAETVGREELLFGDEDEAVDKITAVLEDAELRGEMREELADRSLTTPASFRGEIRDVVDAFR